MEHSRDFQPLLVLGKDLLLAGIFHRTQSVQWEFEGAMAMGSLEVGHHRAYVEFKTEKGRVFFPDSDATGNQARRMNVIAFMDHEINSKTWRDSFPAGTLNTMAVAQEDRARDCPSDTAGAATPRTRPAAAGAWPRG